MVNHSQVAAILSVVNAGIQVQVVYAVVVTSLIYDITYTLADECGTYIIAPGDISLTVPDIPVVSQAGIVIIGSAVDAIFVFRVCALYGNGRRVQFAITLLVTIFMTTSFINALVVLPGIACLSMFSPAIRFSLKLENVYFGLSLAFHTKAGKEVISELGGLRNLFRNERNVFNPVLTSMVRDGTLYFGILLVTTIITLIGSLYPNSSFNVVVSPWYIAMLSFTNAKRLTIALTGVSTDNETPNIIGT
ncbi:hypothetical protein BDQ17DRAFT_1331404 [Cyathus striatus]|nr:hypothetical protein BDQ17DRAFT_1331404 [Cyathus striatus]